MFTKPEIDGVSDAVYGPIKLHPLTPDLNVNFVGMPFASHSPFHAAEAIQFEKCTIQRWIVE